MTIPEIREFLKQKPGYSKWGAKRLAQHLGVTEAKVEEAKGTLKTANRDDYDEYDSKEQHGNDNVNRTNKKNRKSKAKISVDESLEEFCERIGLDFSKIDPVNDVKYWQTMSGERRYSIVPKNIDDGISQEEYADIAKKVLESPIVPKIKRNNYSTNDVMSVINLTDAHIDKAGWLPEEEERTLEDNVQLFNDAFDSLLDEVLIKIPSKIYIIAGSDFWTTNGRDNSTMRGTPQDIVANFRRSFIAGLQCYKRAVSLASEYADVEVLFIEGNHDPDRVFYLGLTLEEFFRNNENVDVHFTNHIRKYVKWGRNLLGFGHGYVEKRAGVNEVPMMMAEEAKEHWATTDIREFYLGDIHHEEEFKFRRTKDYRGTLVRFLRDIGMTSCEWDVSFGYHTYPKSAEAFTYHKEKGRIGSATVNF